MKKVLIIFILLSNLNSIYSCSQSVQVEPSPSPSIIASASNTPSVATVSATPNTPASSIINTSPSPSIMQSTNPIPSVITTSTSTPTPSPSPTAPPSIPKDGLVAYYPFNSNANDEGTNKYNGIVSNAVLTSDRLGNTNSAYSFNGTNAYIDLGSFIPAENIKTISFWAKFNDLDSAQEIVSKSSKSVGIEALIFTLAGNAGLYLFTMPGLTTSDDKSISIPKLRLVTNKWYFITATHNGPNSNMILYLDGSLVSTGTTPSVIKDAPNLFFGKWNGSGRYFNGSLDEVRIYNRALSNQEIKDIYNISLKN